MKAPHVIFCPLSPSCVSRDLLLVKACCMGHLQSMDDRDVVRLLQDSGQIVWPKLE